MNKRLFYFSELWGPFTCQAEGCGKLTYAIELTADENARLPKENGPTAANFILVNKLGEVVCDNHSGVIDKE